MPRERQVNWATPAETRVAVLAIACLISFMLVTHRPLRVYSVRADGLIGALGP
jgi:hypothetical protein